MQFEWDAKIGPATIAAIIGAIAVVAVDIWTASANYRGLTDKIEDQGSKIEQVARGSDRRFETVRNALTQAQTNQTQTADRVSRLETALSYISSQVQRVEAKLNGASPPAPAIPPPKP